MHYFHALSFWKKTSEKPRPGGPLHRGTWRLFSLLFAEKETAGNNRLFRCFPLLDISEKYPGIPAILPATRAADRAGNVVKCSSHVTVTEAENVPQGEPGGVR